MEEREMQEGHGDGAEPVVLDADENHARLVGDIVAEFVASLGERRAMTPDCVVRFGSRASGRPGSLSVVRPETVGDHVSDPIQRARRAEVIVAASSNVMNITKEAS